LTAARNRPRARLVECGCSLNARGRATEILAGTRTWGDLCGRLKLPHGTMVQGAEFGDPVDVLGLVLRQPMRLVQAGKLPDFEFSAFERNVSVKRQLVVQPGALHSLGVHETARIRRVYPPEQHVGTQFQLHSVVSPENRLRARCGPTNRRAQRQLQLRQAANGPVSGASPSHCSLTSATVGSSAHIYQ